MLYLLAHMLLEIMQGCMDLKRVLCHFACALYSEDQKTLMVRYFHLQPQS
jgi:hypothetical protein